MSREWQKHATTLGEHKMNEILINSLYHVDRDRFGLIGDMAKAFNVTCNGNNIVQDDIFNIIKNYGFKQKQQIEIVRIPINDSDFCACTFVRKGIIFIVSNSHLALSKQIFAAAHELYHIIRYVNGEDDDFYVHGSILKAEVIDEAEVESEDRDANAFAGLFLAPSNALREQIEIYGISMNNPTISDVVRLMDIFAIPFKAMTLRLYEDGLINEKKADELLSKDSQTIEDEINFTGTALRWSNSDNIVELGSLKEKLLFNNKVGLITDTRFESDKNRLIELVKEIKNE